MKKIFFLLILIALQSLSICYSQSRVVAELVKKAFSESRQEAVITGLLTDRQSGEGPDFEKSIRGAVYFLLNRNRAMEISQKNTTTLSLEIILGTGPVILDLINSEGSFDGFNVKLASGSSSGLNTDTYAFYRGVVRGKESESLVSLGVYNGEISGMISIANQNLVLGKVKDAERYILYDEKQLPKKNINCGTPDRPGGNKGPSYYANADALNAGRTSLTKCVKLYYETEYDIYTSFNNDVARVKSYVSFLHNQVSTLYLNEGIKVTLNSIFVWDRAESYTSSSTDGLLTHFKSAKQIHGIEGADLGILLTFRDLGGGQAAGFNGLCNTKISERVAVAEVNSTVQYFPVYTWSVFIVAHEFGHLFGSQHTHACAWGPNHDRPIDGCGAVGYYTCDITYIPPQGGTIMSYCHWHTVGINFNLGFGPEPGALIYSNTNAASCLTTCCKTNVTITGTYNIPVVESSTWIVSSGTTTIPTGAMVKLDADPSAGYILLNPGFQTQAGATFSAQAYTGCSGGIPSRINETPFAQKSDLSLLDNLYKTSQIVFPNPTKGVLNIHPAGSLEVIRQIVLSDVSGRKVYILNGNVNRIDISRLTAGMYFYLIETTERKYTGKILKQ